MACMTSFVFASPPAKEVPRPECSVDHVCNVSSYDFVQLATISDYSSIVETFGYVLCKAEIASPQTTDVGLKSQIWDYGNNRYRRIQIGYLNLQPSGILPKHYLSLEKPPSEFSS